jgi:hypothetical protein
MAASVDNMSVAEAVRREIVDACFFADQDDIVTNGATAFFDRSGGFVDGQAIMVERGIPKERMSSPVGNRGVFTGCFCRRRRNFLFLFY